MRIFKQCLSVFFVCLFLLVGIYREAYAALGNTTVCKWKDNKLGAITMAFDDSLVSQIDFVFPRLLSHNLVGTFWINPTNPGTSREKAYGKTASSPPGASYATTAGRTTRSRITPEPIMK